MTKSDVKVVARDLGITLTEAQIKWVVLYYDDFAKQDPTGTWDLIIEEAINHVLEMNSEELTEELGTDNSIGKVVVYTCSKCGSDNVSVQTWVKINEGNRLSGDIYLDDEGNCWCEDCAEHYEIVKAEVDPNSKVIGFQVVGDEDGDYFGEIHPDMAGSFCIYNLTEAQSMNSSGWRLLAIWSGDIEEPTMMFEGDPRG
jgi:Zn finger protein HypA/HybF involved in hydrogenase expression